MPTRIELLAEANRRGLLPPDKQALLQEAQKRGLLPANKVQAEEPQTGLVNRLKQGMTDFYVSTGQMANAAADKLGVGDFDLSTMSRVSPEEVKRRREVFDTAGQMQKERKGDPGLGASLAIAAGNPANWAAGLARGPLWLQGLIAGGANEATTPMSQPFDAGQKTEDVIGSGALGAVAAPLLGATINTALHPLDTAKAIGNAASNQASKLFGSFTRSQADDKAYQLTADALRKSGATPEQIATQSSRAQNTGLGETLDEFTQNRQLMQMKKTVAQSPTQAGDNLSKFVEARAESTVPQGVKNFAAPIVKENFTKADDIYKTLTDKRVAPGIVKNIQKDPVVAQAFTTVRNDPILAREIQDLPDNSFAVIQQVKRAMDAMKSTFATQGDNVRATSVSKAQRSMLDSIEQFYPRYREANTLWRKGAAADDLITIVKETNDGSVGTLYNRLFAKEADRDAWRSALGDDTYTGLQTIMEGMKNIKRGGLGGSDTARNLTSKAALEERTGASGLESAIDLGKSSFGGKLVRWYSEKVRGKDYDAIARMLQNPDIERLGKMLNKPGLKDRSKKALADAWLKDKGPSLLRQLGVAGLTSD